MLAFDVTKHNVIIKGAMCCLRSLSSYLDPNKRLTNQINEAICNMTYMHEMT